MSWDTLRSDRKLTYNFWMYFSPSLLPVVSSVQEGSGLVEAQVRHILAGQVRLWGAFGVKLTNLCNELIVLLWERTPARTWSSFGFPVQNRSHQWGTDRPWELSGVKGRKEALGKAAERKEEKHSGGNSSGGVEDKPQHWEKLLWMVHRAVIQR